MGDARPFYQCTDIFKYVSPRAEHEFLSKPLLGEGRVHSGPRSPKGKIAVTETSPGVGRSGMINQKGTAGTKK